MLNMDVDDVRTFVAVAESGSISAASRELHLTQPAVSRRIQRLESALGALLIDRAKRPLALTDAGRAAVERCRRFLAVAAELKDLGGGAPASRDVRIGVAHALTELALTEPIDELRRACPAASLRLYTGWSRDLLNRVKSGALDAAIILVPEREGAPAGVAAEAIARDHLAIVASRDWPRRPYRLQQLADQPWILNPEGCAARAGLQRELARVRKPLRVAVEAYNYELQLRLIARGRGLGLIPGRLLMRSPSRAGVRTLRVRGLEFPQLIWLVRGDSAAGLDDLFAALRRALGALNRPAAAPRHPPRRRRTARRHGAAASEAG
jgi:DNA-binding transcriptional LysR family regulator